MRPPANCLPVHAASFQRETLGSNHAQASCTPRLTTRPRVGRRSSPSPSTKPYRSPSANRPARSTSRRRSRSSRRPLDDGCPPAVSSRRNRTRLCLGCPNAMLMRFLRVERSVRTGRPSAAPYVTIRRSGGRPGGTPADPPGGGATGERATGHTSTTACPAAAHGVRATSPRPADRAGSRVAIAKTPPRSKATTWSAAAPGLERTVDLERMLAGADAGRARSRAVSRSRGIHPGGRSPRDVDPRPSSRRRSAKSTPRRLSGSTSDCSHSSEPW